MGRLPRLGLALCFLLGACWPGQVRAHMTSMGRLFVRIEPAKRTVEIVLSISRDDVGVFLKLDTNNDRRADEGEVEPHRGAVASYFASRLVISNNSEICPVDQQRFMRKRERESKRRLFFAQRVICPKPLGQVMIQNTVMFDDVGGYRHIARIQVGKAVYAPYFSRMSPRYVVSIEAPAALASKTPQGGKPVVSSHGEGWLKALFGFIFKGVWHILIGLDHIAFVFCLLLVARSWTGLLWVITSFTLGHSLTLILCVLDIVFLPPGPTEALIALTIAYVGVENILYRNSDEQPRFRFAITALFGLIHGFGFSYTLRELQLPKGALVPSLLGFNVGIELGQIAIVALVYPLLRYLMKKPDYPQYLTYASGSVVLVAIYWFVTRAFF